MHWTSSSNLIYPVQYNSSSTHLLTIGSWMLPNQRTPVGLIISRWTPEEENAYVALVYKLRMELPFLR